jgi:hypothetical protein
MLRSKPPSTQRTAEIGLKWYLLSKIQTFGVLGDLRGSSLSLLDVDNPLTVPAEQ